MIQWCAQIRERAPEQGQTQNWGANAEHPTDRRFRLDVRKRFFTRGWLGMDRAPQGSGHGCKLLDLKKHLDNALRYRGWILRGDRSCTPYGSLSTWDILWFCDGFPVASQDCCSTGASLIPVGPPLCNNHVGSIVRPPVMYSLGLVLSRSGKELFWWQSAVLALTTAKKEHKNLDAYDKDKALSQRNITILFSMRYVQSSRCFKDGSISHKAGSKLPACGHDTRLTKANSVPRCLSSMQNSTLGSCRRWHRCCIWFNWSYAVSSTRLRDKELTHSNPTAAVLDPTVLFMASPHYPEGGRFQTSGLWSVSKTNPSPPGEAKQDASRF